MLSDVRIPIGNPNAALTVLLESPLGTASVYWNRFPSPSSPYQRIPASVCLPAYPRRASDQTGQSGWDRHEEPDDRFRSWAVVRRFGSKRIEGIDFYAARAGRDAIGRLIHPGKDCQLFDLAPLWPDLIKFFLSKFFLREAGPAAITLTARNAGMRFPAKSRQKFLDERNRVRATCWANSKDCFNPWRTALLCYLHSAKASFAARLPASSRDPRPA